MLLAASLIAVQEKLASALPAAADAAAETSPQGTGADAHQPPAADGPSAPNVDPSTGRAPAATIPAATTAATTATDTGSQDAGAPKADETVHFVSEVQPILANYCVRCHGAEKRGGGLRLDTRDEAVLGGDSGKAIVGGSLQSNELWARVSSDVAAYRMPKNAAPLSPEQINILQRWIEQGSHWPPPIQKNKTFFDQPWIKSFTDIGERYQAEYQYVLPWGIAYLVLMCGLWLVLRARAARAAGRQWAAGRIGQWCGRATNGGMLLLVIVASLGMVLAIARGHILNLQAQLAKATATQKRETSTWARTVFGYPPKPIRGPGPKHLTATYYRGNCERNEKLFNGGNYLTCTFHVNLCDSAHRPLHVGDAVPPDGLFVRMEIERAPGTTDLLYSPEGMASVFLLDRFVEQREDRGDIQPFRLEPLEDGQRWVTYVPITPQPNGKQWSGTIYVYTGRVTETQIDGNPHYGIGYQLLAEDGKIAPESDLWMDSFGNPAFEPPVKVKLLPYQEWFGEQPLPEIVGENTDDPTLLGVDEHVRKGLIKPPAEPTAENQPQAPPAEETPPAAPTVQETVPRDDADD